MTSIYVPVNYPAMPAGELWWSNNGNYVLFGVLAVTIIICFFVLRRKD